MNPIKTNLACPKRFGPDQNNLYPSKTILTVQNHFGSIEGQDIQSFIFFITFNAISQKLFWTHSNFLDWTITSWKLVKRQNSVAKRSFRSGPKLFGPNQIIWSNFGLGRRSQWRFQNEFKPIFFRGFPIKRCKLCREVVVK